MPKAVFNCPKCDRSFSMKAHLARHMNTIHASPARRKTVVKKRAKRAAKKGGAARVGRFSPQRGVPSDGGARVLSEMDAYRADLMDTRNSLDTQISAIEAAMGAMGGITMKAASRPRGPVAKGGRGRPGSLKESIINVLQSVRRPMSPKELSDAVVQAGYKTRAKDLTKAISNILPQMKMVKKVGRGIYSA